MKGRLIARRWFAAALVVVPMILAACAGDQELRGTPRASRTPSQTATVEPSASLSAEEVVIEAYLNYWEVYSEALYDLDENRLNEVMMGPRLDRAIREIKNLRDQGRAVDIDVKNNPVLVELKGDQAIVFDEYENRSTFIDPETKEPLSDPGEAEVIRDRVTLTRVAVTWSVFDSVREVD